MKSFSSLNDIKRPLIAKPRNEFTMIDGEESTQLRSCCYGFPKFYITYQSGELYLVCEKCIKLSLWSTGKENIAEVKIDE